MGKNLAKQKKDNVNITEKYLYRSFRGILKTYTCLKKHIIDC